jgi:hypothetical protein
MTTPLGVDTGGEVVCVHKGAGPWQELNFTLLGAGAGAAPTINAANSDTNPPCTAEVSSITYVSTGVNTIVLYGAYFGVASWSAVVDDINGSTPVEARLGQFTNLHSSNALQLTLTTYSSAFAAADVALNTPIRIRIMFKKGKTGAAA